MRGLLDNAAVRLVAAMLALSVAGVPDLIAPPDAPAGHRCQCPIREGRHDCDCPLCHAEAARHAAEAAAHGDHDHGEATATASASAAKVPPCHLALAKKLEASDKEAAARRAAAGPILSSTCGTDDRRPRPPPAVEFFTVPTPTLVALVVTVTPVGEERSDRLVAAFEPETPPPRRASPGVA